MAEARERGVGLYGMARCGTRGPRPGRPRVSGFPARVHRHGLSQRFPKRHPVPKLDDPQRAIRSLVPSR